MAAGLGQGTREAYDSLWGNLALQCDQLMAAIQQAKAHLDQFSLAQLEALPSIASPANPYSAADAQQLKNSAADLSWLQQIRSGAAVITGGAPVAGSGYLFPGIGQINGVGQ